MYKEYHECYKKYLDIKTLYEKLIEEKERLFLETQPKSTKYDKVSVDGGKNTNTFDNYLMKKEKRQLDKQIEEAKTLMDERLHILRQKELDLRQSKEVIDKIYAYRFIDCLSVKKISGIMYYQEANIYRKINEIKRNIKNG